LRASSGPHSGRRGRAAQGAPGSPRASGAPAAPGLLLDRVLYRDALCLVVDKPAGLPVHAGPKGGPNLEDHLDALRFGLPRRPGLAHRLDRDTSGCLVLGRHRQALARLGKLFASGRVEKVYWAVVRGGPRAEEGRIEAPLRKRDELRGWWMETHPKGQPAVTDWRVLGRSADGGLAWLECRPRTGRTHQIRVHCASVLGCPVLGDPVYGPRREGPAAPLHLHARAVSFLLHPSKRPVAAEAPVPAHMAEALAACGWDGAAGRAPPPPPTSPA
jgi:tRNA pseudouridine32 synthase / 23S rRNA pseudouridine746 synthase